MNMIRTIESTTLLAVGAFCTAAITSIILHSANLLASDAINVASAPVTQLPAVVIVGKRLASIETANIGNQHVAG